MQVERRERASERERKKGERIGESKRGEKEREREGEKAREREREREEYIFLQENRIWMMMIMMMMMMMMHCGREKLLDCESVRRDRRWLIAVVDLYCLLSRRKERQRYGHTQSCLENRSYAGLEMLTDDKRRRRQCDIKNALLSSTVSEAFNINRSA